MKKAVCEPSPLYVVIVEDATRPFRLPAMPLKAAKAEASALTRVLQYKRVRIEEARK